jgi:two-component system nitrate/nitrite response regulator NarL
MSLRVPTVIVEPNMLIREALASLLERYSYRIVGSANGAASFVAQGPPEPPSLVLVGAETMDHALAEVDRSRKLWPDTKIMLLLQGASDPDDVREMMASEMDGCVPLSVSQDTLMRTVDLVMLANAKIMVMVRPPHSHLQPSMNEAASLDETEAPQLQNEGHYNGNGNDSLPVPEGVSAPLALVNTMKDIADAGLSEPRQRNIPRLSERESQILDSIVCGFSNKIIARKCGITEATVKVHMKSILRKIQVANRTQAAVWAMENDYAVRVEKRLLEDDADGAAA